MNSQQKYIRINGIADNLSPLILSGNLVASGVAFDDALELARDIIDTVSGTGINRDDFISIIIKNLPPPAKVRYVTLELVKQFLLSAKSRSPLFIFLGGLTGKTLIANFVSQQLGLTQTIAIDNEKFRLVDVEKRPSYFLKATYESPRGYIRTVSNLVPWMIRMVERNLFDYKRYKKWCYLWEGIYLSPFAIAKLYERFHDTSFFLSTFILPQFDVIRNGYLLRWQKELGVEKLKKRKNIIDRYLKNIEAIRAHISTNLDPVASFVIESPILEERLTSFYALLYQTLKDIADRKIPGWVEKVCDNPSFYSEYVKMLEK